jgi:hypothetical protein
MVTVACAMFAAGSAFMATPAAATGGGVWSGFKSMCTAPLAPVVPKSSPFVQGNRGCARLVCPSGWTPTSPYKDGSSPVFYSLAVAVYQETRSDRASTTGCIKYNASNASKPASLLAWLDDYMIAYWGLPTFKQLVDTRPVGP